MNLNRLKFFLKTPLRPVSEGPAMFVNKPTKTTKCGYNLHRSNRAKEGLYHGKDVMFGHSISHSHTRSKKKWFPNVQNKRVFSEALDDWVRFKITTRALKEVDNVGGIDNYILSLDEKSVSESNYVTKIRGLIAGKLFHQGLLSDRIIRRLGYDKEPPSVAEKSAEPAAQS
ncbi:hypothetical protein B484DRAFT_404761 [Ochromonadaceae sp. CCMP2298]|nr:hypothetical protein B484DRAFT_404761 [Ochromonadaceae sp. CCMP2298]|mmetsp:Transcript_12146/g.27095  ORF Transcript_12146/g.27095 Transcript_12146/m.27095 type:complete len:171 (-) Transcript_12146:121-633(-)